MKAHKEYKKEIDALYLLAAQADQLAEETYKEYDRLCGKADDALHAANKLKREFKDILNVERDAAKDRKPTVVSEVKFYKDRATANIHPILRKDMMGRYEV